MSRRALTPRTLFDRLAPRWRLDRPTIGERWRLHDAYVVRRATGAVVEIELREGRASLRLTVAPGPGEPGCRRVGGLALAWGGEAPPGDGERAVDALEATLSAGARASDPSGSWFVPEGAETDAPASIAAEVEVVNVPRRAGRDAERLRADFAHYARLYGARPNACEVRVDGRATPAAHYPAPANGSVPASGALYPVPANFHRREFRRFLGRLGFALDGAVLRTVPTAAAFAHAVARERGAPPPFSLRLCAGWRGSMSPYTWVRHVVQQHVWPVTVAPPWAVFVHRALRVAPAFRRVPLDVGMLPHDASLHALGLHAVPRDRWETLTGVARERLRAGPLSLHGQVAGFFEGTLTKTAWDAWSGAPKPDAFGRRFDAEMPALERALRAL